MEKRTGKWGPERKQTKGGGSSHNTCTAISIFPTREPATQEVYRAPRGLFSGSQPVSVSTSFKPGKVFPLQTLNQM